MAGGREASTHPDTPKLYSDLARWWPLFSAPAEYVEEAAFYATLLKETDAARPTTLLELGSGGGNNAYCLKVHFDETVLVDIAPDMLAVSRSLNPDCEHLQGDMRTVRLGRQFDRVFVHDAIAYMTTAADLRQAIETAFVHCAPGGRAVFAPDHVRETFKPGTEHGGNDGEHESIRFLEWTWDPDPSDFTCLVDYTYVMRLKDGSVTVEHERHTEGLFPREDWLRTFTDVGFAPKVVPFDHSDLEPGSYELFVCTKGV